jgi:hypothetical protein
MRHVWLAEDRVSSRLYPHWCRASERPSKDDRDPGVGGGNGSADDPRQRLQIPQGSVPQSDGVSQYTSVLMRYDAELGTSPGRFIGQGLAGLGNGIGIRTGTQVTDERLFRVLVMVQDPLAGGQLGRPRAHRRRRVRNM